MSLRPADRDDPWPDTTNRVHRSGKRYAQRIDIPVFDRGGAPVSGELAAGLTDVASFSPEFRRTARDSRKPRAVVTAILMGDPAPGRSALAMPERST